MDSRREFIKKAALLSGGAGLMNVLPASIQRAFAINPEKASTYLDAEHVVILMQENRSFDHCYGSLQGVRGFDDPRAIRLANNNPVWLQPDKDNNAYAPFRLDIKETRSTFIGSLPHSWPDQVDARNNGKYDQWIISKGSGHKDFKNAPLTLGYYNRADLPFYYALADAFTICDQNFCSSLTGTTPNRLYLWTGTIRPEQAGNSPSHVMNSDTDYHKEVGWKSFPERLEENGISWKIYQNEISLESGLSGQEDSWLANFTDNPLEWFTQYGVRYSEVYQQYMNAMESQVPAEIASLEKQLAQVGSDKEITRKLQRDLISKKNLLERAKNRHQWSKENFEKLSEQEKNLFRKAFTTNSSDPNYRKLTTLSYDDNGIKREMTVPAGDSLFQFRQDVSNGELPTVSWIVGSENFSDHPGAPWYGAWYVSEVMNILTKNPEVWKKTIFILCYDENDGYFDHVPPFVPPHPSKPDTGKVSKGIDTSLDYVLLENDLKMRGKENARESPIGLGFRVPLVVASPWSRGGAVCSQVFDHTSILQFLEKFLTEKTGKPIKETNISSWRRAVCGDLTAVFTPYYGEKLTLPEFLGKEEVYESINKSQYKKDPSGYRIIQGDELKNIKTNEIVPKQEKGSRPSCRLFYELDVTGELLKSQKIFQLDFISHNKLFREHSNGAPFVAYWRNGKEVQIRNYAVLPGDKVSDSWSVSDLIDGRYECEVYGPNGFYRHFIGTEKDPGLSLAISNTLLEEHLNLFVNVRSSALNIEIKDLSYGAKPIRKRISKSTGSIKIDLSKTDLWYDFLITVDGFPEFKRRLAGKIENGTAWGKTDPAIGRS